MPMIRRGMAGAACLAAVLAAGAWLGLFREPARESVAPAAGQAAVAQQARPAAAASESGQEAEPAPAPKSYLLSAPEPPAPPAERARALGVIDYANTVDGELSEGCGQEAAQVMAGLVLYRQEYDAFRLPASGGEQCLSRKLTPPKDVFNPETAAAMTKSLADMDRERAAMRKSYDELCAYVADLDLKDNGAQGRKLSETIAGRLGSYARAASVYHEVLDRESRAAQDLLLRGHPLRDHVGAALDIAALVRRMADDIAYAEPDPAVLDKPLAELEEELHTASWLPFPIAGEVEMHYRHFLKHAARAAASLRQGQVASFTPEVRQGLNEAWQAAKQEYNRFVDAVNAR